ncbi:MULTISPECIES: heavy metal translocating P-type ATPase [unclassified Micromonospora]|uniref:heavy metal translocating P-type ATPase n=1 Tax=unclassified Micromonospora TaxID=2617518 RepID=UPI003626EB9D
MKTLTDTSNSVELAVTGMTCGACAARVERQLNKLDGVEATVNYATDRAMVRLIKPVPTADLIATVEKAGYQAAPVQTAAPADEEEDGRVGDLWRRLIVALLVGVPLADLSITLILVPSIRFSGWKWVLLALALPVVTWCAWPIHRRAVAAARHRTSSMETLVSLGVISATLWSLYTIFGRDRSEDHHAGGWGLLFQPEGSIYLEVAAGVVIFVLAGRFFEARAKRAAGDALRGLARLGAKHATVLRDGVEHRVPAGELRVDDEIVVRPGETVATDGVVLSGASSVDTSAMTGESIPTEVGPGEPVTGGTTVLSGRVLVRATRVGGDTQLAQLVRMVERAQSDKADVQRVADRVSAVFVPAVIALASITGVGWALAGAPAERFVGTALAVLIIACPCALGLATPTALLAASGRGAQLGIFIKGHQALESARSIDTVVLDKTGTVTTGRMVVADLWAAEHLPRVSLLTRAGAVENAAEHLVARAIADYARAEVGDLPEAEDFRALPGLGACGVVAGQPVLVGSPRLVESSGIALPQEVRDRRAAWASKGCTCVLVAVDGTVAGALALTDTVKPSAATAVARLRAAGLRTVLLTGDNQAAAAAVAAEIGVDETIAEVLPADKAAVIEELQRAGHSVAMVGDGVNDAPALARADLGMAIATGTDVAIGAADIILVRDDLRTVPAAVALARRTLRTIHGNLGWAFGYNVAALPIAAAGLLSPLVSSAAMALSSLLVISNSLRLRNFRLPSTDRTSRMK